MKSCPRCNHKLTTKAPEVCPACGFALVVSDNSPTLRKADTTKIAQRDADIALANARTLQPPNDLFSSGENESHDSNVEITGGVIADPNDKTLMAGPMETMSRPLDDKSSHSTPARGSTPKPPGSAGSQEKTIIGRRLPTIVNPQAALDAAEAYSEGLKSLIPPRTMVRKEEAADSSDYQLLKRIGSGAYGVVFQAKQVPLQRPVAVKLLQTGTEAEEHQQRIKNEFLREAQFTGRLEHPNIVPIHDIGLTVSPKGKVNPFYVMKEIRGESWQSVIKEKSLKDNLEIFKNVINAIAFSHSQNVLHCDLKPDNVMLGEFGEVLVVDWGQAVDLSMPETMRPGGTPAYISPEMAQYWIDIYLNHKTKSKSQAEVGIRSDVYLLGSLLFETMAGTPPHCKTPGEPPYEVIRTAAKNEIVDYDENVDKDLMHIALRALRATNENHIETTADLLLAIDQYENRSLSVQLRRRADQLLETAVAEGDYDAFQRSRFSYEEAIEKWDGNTPAREGLQNANLRCAEHALTDQNFDLGLDVLENADGDQETALREQLTAGKKTRDRRKRLVAGLAIGLAGSILLGILVNGFMIKENLKTGKARDLARDELRDLNESIEPMRLKEAKLKSEIATQEIKFENDKAKQKKAFEEDKAKQEKEFKAITAQKAAEQEAELKAQAKELTGKLKIEKAKLNAEITNLDKQKKELSEEKKELSKENEELSEEKEALADEKQSLEGQVVNLNESSKLLRYKGGLTQVSTDLQTGDYLNARKKLGELKNQQDWEVARLNLLAHREIKSVYPAEPITSIAATNDGQQLAIAFADRIEIRQLDRLDQASNKIQQADVSAIAISPTGNRIYAGKPGDGQLTAGQIAIFDASAPEQTTPTRTLNAQSVSIDQIEISETGTAVLSVGKPSALRQSAGQGLEEPLMVWIDGQQVDVNLVLPKGSRPKFDSASFSRDGQRILLTNQSGLPQDQAAYVFERNETGYRWIATSPIEGISAATFANNSNDVVAGIQNANTGSYSLARWRYSSGSLSIVSPLTSKAIQLRQQGDFVIATQSDRQTTIWDWRNKQSMKLKGQSRSAEFCFVKPGKRLKDCQVITAAIGEQPELLAVNLSMYQPEYQRQSAGWSPKTRPASVTAAFSSAATKVNLQAFGNDFGMASVTRNDNQVQWNISAWQYQVVTDDFVFAQSAEDYLYRYDRASGALDRVLTKLARFLKGRQRVVDFQVSDDGRVALIQTNSKDPKFLLWNVQQDQLIREVNYGQQNLFGTGSQKILPKLSLSRDGKWVIGAKVGVFGWPVNSGQLVRFTNNDASAPRSTPNSIVFVRDSQQVLVSWQNRVIQFDLDRRQQIASRILAKVSDAQAQDNLLDAIQSNGQIQILAAENTSKGGILLLSLENQNQLTRFANASFASFTTTKNGITAVAGGLDQNRKIRLKRWSQGNASPQEIPLPPTDDDALAKHFVGFERVYVSSQHGVLLQTSQRNRGSARRMWSSLSIATDLSGNTAKPTSLGKLQVLSRPSIKQIVAQPKQAATLANNQILFWKLSDNGVKPDGVFDARATTMQMAPDSNTLAICTTDNQCLLYDFSKRQKLAEFDLKDNQGQVTAIAWRSDSKAVALGRTTGAIELLDLESDDDAKSDSSILDLETSIKQAISGLAYSKDGSLLVTVADEGIAILVRANDDKETNLAEAKQLSETVYGHAEQRISAADISADGNRIVSGSNTGRITIWNSQTQPKDTKDVQEASGERELLTMPNLHQSPISIVQFVSRASGEMILSAERSSGKNEIIAWPAAKVASAQDSDQ